MTKSKDVFVELVDSLVKYYRSTRMWVDHDYTHIRDKLFQELQDGNIDMKDIKEYLNNLNIDEISNRCRGDMIELTDWMTLRKENIPRLTSGIF